MKKLEKRKYKDLVWLPEMLVQDSVYLKWEVSLAYFVFLKGLFKNNTVYNFNYQKLSEISGLPKSSLNRHIKILSKKGLIRFHNKNLTFVGANHLKKDWGNHIIAVEKSKNIKQIILSIQFTRILRNLDQQVNIISKKEEIKKLQESNFLDKTEAKSLLRLRKSLKNEIPVNKKLIISNAKFGKLVNRGKSSGLNLQKKLNELGYIYSSKNFEKYSDAKFDLRGFYSLELPSCYRLSSKGYIFKSMPNQIALVGCNK